MPLNSSNELTLTQSTATSTTLVGARPSSTGGNGKSGLPSADMWQGYPYTSHLYNPFTEWGEHYSSVFERDLWPQSSKFVLQDIAQGRVTERVIEGSQSVDRVLQEDPDVRIFYCDSKLCDDLVTRASFCVDDLKKIFYAYNFSVIFVDRFIGRNRCTTGSRKTADPDNPQRTIAYDIWYDLPCRIYGAEHEYHWHFILFTVYVHYDVVRKKTVVFYIHRLGSEHPSAAEESSRKLKDRVKTSLQHAARDPNHLTALRNCPFLVQLPTLTSCTTFWTETLHKERVNMWAKEDEGKIDLASIDTWKLHDILRYVHSYLANLRIVEQGLRFVNAEHRWFSSEIEHGQAYQDSPWYGTVCDAITAQEFQIGVIIIWTHEYFKRMSQIDSRTTGRIAEQTQKDAISMQTIAIVTMFFLPATSVAAVLDLGWFSHGIFEEMKYLWVYFLVSFGLTAIVLVAWYYWLWRRMRRVNGSEMAAFLKEPLPGRKTV